MLYGDYIDLETKGAKPAEAGNRHGDTQGRPGQDARSESAGYWAKLSTRWPWLSSSLLGQKITFPHLSLAASVLGNMIAGSLFLGALLLVPHGLSQWLGLF